MGCLPTYQPLFLSLSSSSPFSVTAVAIACVSPVLFLHACVGTQDCCDYVASITTTRVTAIIPCWRSRWWRGEGFGASVSFDWLRAALWGTGSSVHIQFPNVWKSNTESIFIIKLLGPPVLKRLTVLHHIKSLMPGWWEWSSFPAFWMWATHNDVKICQTHKLTIFVGDMLNTQGLPGKEGSVRDTWK